MAAQVELAAAVRQRRMDNEPIWQEGLLGRHTQLKASTTVDKFQQSDNLKPFYEKLVHCGIHSVYEEYKTSKDPFEPTHQPLVFDNKKKTTKPRKVLIIGAGMSGLSAAYELKRAGHSVQILEMQERVGGRVKTFGETQGFSKGLYVDGGAMRLPCKPDEEATHYLTDFYVKKFQLTKLPFKNSDKNALLKFYNMKPMTFRDQYFDKTVECVKKQLTSQLIGKTDYEEVGKIWREWVTIWSEFSVNGFLRSNIDGVLSKLPETGNYRDEIESSDLRKFIPWPEEAITAYTVFNYTEQLDQDLVQYLRHDLGKWWSDNMHRIQGGMSKLPEKFYMELEEDITFNVTINGIKYTATKENVKVEVEGYYSTSSRPCKFDGDAVIVTTPLNLIRQMKIESNPQHQPSHDPMNCFYRAIEDIWYGPATKIMIQTKKRFWESQNITGGFSKTNLPVGQIFYTPPPENGSKKGLLLAYTWKSEALQFGALHPDVAIREAVRQIAEIHKEIEQQFEVGAIESWYNEPSAQGAYVLLKPYQYRHVECLMYYPIYNVFFAGDGISFAAGWIQGALESGLRAAYQFYARNEEDKLSELLME